MMKYFLPILLLVSVVGCSQLNQKPDSPEPPAVTPNEPVQPPVEPVEPPTPPVAPQAPVSREYLRGYWDGYNGTWLAPGAWVVNDQYRNGRAQGRKDREAGLQPRYPLP